MKVDLKVQVKVGGSILLAFSERIGILKKKKQALCAAKKKKKNSKNIGSDSKKKRLG